MAGRVQIVLEVDDRGTVVVRQFKEGIDKLPPALEKAGSSNNVVFTQMNKAHRQATESVQLLAGRIGLELPRAVSRWIASLPGAQRAFQAAFNGVIIGTLVAQLVQAAFTLKATYDEFYSVAARRMRAEEALAKFVSDQSLRSTEHVRELKVALAGVGGSYQSQLGELFARFKNDLDLTNKLLSTNLPADLRQKILAEREAMAGLVDAQAKLIGTKRELELLDKSAAAQAAVTLDLDGRQAIEIERLTKLKALSVQVAAGMKDAEIADAEAKLINIEATKKLTAALVSEQAIRQQMFEAKWAMDKQFADQLAKAGAPGAAAAGIKIEQDLERRTTRSLSMIHQIESAENAAAIAVLPPWQQSYAEIAENLRIRAEDIHDQFLHIRDRGGQEARLLAAAWAQAGAQMRNQLANDLERAFDDLTSGRLWETILRQFKHMVFQMIAQWMLGQRAMSAATVGGSAAQGGGFSLGGMLGGLLGNGGGGIFGGLAPVAIQNFAGGGGGSASRGGGFQFGSFTPGVAGLAGLPGSAGGALGTGGILATGATVSTTAKLSMGAQLAGMLPMLAGAGGLIGGRAIGFGGPGRGALAGGLMGAGAVGLSLAALMGPLAGMAGSMTAIGALFGPLGIGIIAAGALLGLFMGMKSRDKQKAKAMDILNQGRAEWKKVISDFEGHRIDYSSAVAGVTQVWQQMVQQWSSPSLGKYGGIAIQNNAAEFRRALQQIEDLQAKRQWTASSPMFNAAGEFSSGGFVQGPGARGQGSGFGPLGIPLMPSRAFGRMPSFASGGAVPIIAHTGEFVMQRSAVQRIGRGKLEAMNAGGSRGGGPMIVVQGPLVQAAPGMSTEALAEATIRKLERLLRDQGVSLRA